MPRTEAPDQAVDSKPDLRINANGVFAAVLTAVTIAAFWPALHGGMLWDDDQHFTPPSLQSWQGLRRIWCEAGVVPQYYPLTHSVFWIEQHLWGNATLGYHLLNLALHLTIAFLFWRLLVRLEIPGAKLAAAIFALHPVHVESVAWISELKNTLSGAFCLGAALLYVRFDQTRRKRDYALAAGLFLLGLASKSVIATLPAALLVIFWWKRGRLNLRRDVLPLLPLLVVGIGSGIFTAWVERRFIGAAGAEYYLTWIQRLLIAGRALCFYLSKLLWPQRLVFIYPRWRVSARAAWQYLYPAGVALVAAALWLARKRRRAPWAAFLLYAGMLVPVLGFVNIFPFRYSFVADHFQYLASMPVFALFAAGVALLLDRLSAGARAAGWSASILLVAGLAFLTWRQSHLYQNLFTLYDAVIHDNPTCWLAYNNRGYEYHMAGQYDAAIADFSSAIRIKRDYAEAYSNRGNSYSALGHMDWAIVDYDKAIQFQPDYVPVYNNRGSAYHMIGQDEWAIADLDHAIQLKPMFWEAYFNRGCAYETLGRFDQAMADFSRAVALNPGLFQAYDRLGSCDISIGRPEQAIAEFDRAIQLCPTSAEAYDHRGSACIATRQYEQAVADLSRAIKLKPDFAEAYNNRAAAHTLLKHYDLAWADIERCRALGTTPRPDLITLLNEKTGRERGGSSQ